MTLRQIEEKASLWHPLINAFIDARSQNGSGSEIYTSNIPSNPPVKIILSFLAFFDI